MLVIGVEDETRNVKGVENPLDTQERLANVISTGIAPPLMPAIEIVPWRDKALIVVEVFPSYSRPHYLVAEGVERGTMIRVGPSNRRADEPMCEELRRTVRNESYDIDDLARTEDTGGAATFFGFVLGMAARRIV